MNVIKRRINDEEQYIVVIKNLWDAKDYPAEGSDDILLAYLNGKFVIIEDIDTWDYEHPDCITTRTEVLYEVSDIDLHTDYEQIIKDFKHQENVIRLEEVRHEIEEKKAEEMNLLQLLGIK